MHHARTRRFAAGAVVTTLLGGLLSLLIVQPASANHGDLTLEVYREVTTITTGQTAHLTARLQTAQGTPTIDGSGNGASIDFEIIGGGGIDGEGGADTPLTPDRTCTTSTANVAAPYPECTVDIIGANAGTLVVRAWIDEDNANATAEGDTSEGRLSSPDTDCTTETEPPTDDTGREAACLDDTPAPGDTNGGDEPDDTDVVQIRVNPPGAVATKLDCPAATPAPAVTGQYAFVDCRVTDQSGNPMPGVQVDGENLSTIQNPEGSGANTDPADYNGTPSAEQPACVSGPTGICSVRITAINTQQGTAKVCFWVDADPALDGTGPVIVDKSYDPSSAGTTDGGQCDVETDPDAAEGNDLTDPENVVFSPPVLSSIDVEPDSSVGTTGTAHTLTARLLDQFGRQWTTAKTVKFEWLAGSAQDTDGSTPALPDQVCNTTGTGDNPGTCTYTYSSSSPGTDTICGFYDTTTATCGDEKQAGTSVANADLVVRKWNAAAVTTTTAPTAEDVAKTQGYTLVGADGGIFNYGTSEFHGSTGDMKLNKPVIGMANKKGGTGYWLVASDGGIFTFGDAEFFGSMGDKKLNAPILGMEATPSGKGYWLFAADGGIFTFGDAAFHGSTGDQKLNAPVIGMAITEKGDGYWLVARDGGIFTFDAPFWGSTGSMKLNEPVFDMGATPGDKGYWLVARDGGIFSFGDAESKFYGSAVGATAAQVIGLGVTPTGNGYWIADNKGAVFPFGDARFLGDRRSATNNATTVGFATVPKK